MTVIFGFSRPISKYNAMSALIRAVSKRPFSHSYARFSEKTTGTSLVFQASGLSVNLIEYSNFQIKESVIEEYSCDIPDSLYSPMVNYMLVQSGTNYSLFQLLLDLFYIIFKVKLPFKATGEVCSEQSARLAIELGIKVPGDISYYTPSEFQEFCAANMKKVN